MFFYFFPSSIRLLLFIISVIFNTLCFQLSVFIVFNGLDFLIFRVQSIFFASLSLSSSPVQRTEENLYNRDFLCDFLCFVVFSLFSSIFFFSHFIILHRLILLFVFFGLVCFISKRNRNSFDDLWKMRAKKLFFVRLCSCSCAWLCFIYNSSFHIETDTLTRHVLGFFIMFD